MKNLYRLIIVITSIILLAGCATHNVHRNTENYNYNNKDGYLHAQNRPRLIIPKGVSKMKISDYYHIPNTGGPVPKVSFAPPGFKSTSHHWL